MHFTIQFFVFVSKPYGVLPIQKNNLSWMLKHKIYLDFEV